ncbi:hypothetical protein Pmar_PMAR000052 [Perkinsus marinus ATCC 50983]|uniref:Uncharacterized protein n=1 Tax=Perkinsus marinus (strain ATCC 50983 / TXsc) TaxID=423536 RepID=C5KPR9_PERM5|nr:hypothetical protein Pmar_PMAR000052 [Perkinsus marinus ATCC 50983]EER13466.1 hypothetical protein Pmar_PMAR000052 [Perkinsus marinus ATCC 50983]|eukprot:XP_002781671.1 hypothetical protein Pmar_PMAR000052 [Perkinsus marinus ATCC 50983]
MYRCGGTQPASVLYYIAPSAMDYCPHTELCDCTCHCPCACHDSDTRLRGPIDLTDKPLIECIRGGYPLWWLKTAVTVGKWKELNWQEPDSLNTALHVACQPPYYDYSLVEHLLRYGACPDITNAKAETPLHIAAGSNNLPCARLLYIHGSRLDLMDYKHRLPEDRTRDERTVNMLNVWKLLN